MRPFLFNPPFLGDYIYNIIKMLTFYLTYTKITDWWSG